MTVQSNEFMAQASCNIDNAELFFTPGLELLGKAVCRKCIVQTPCLDYGLATDQSGVFGNTSEADRRELIA